MCTSFDGSTLTPSRPASSGADQSHCIVADYGRGDDDVTESKRGAQQNPGAGLAGQAPAGGTCNPHPDPDA